MRILIIDDSVISRRLIVDALTTEPLFETITAPNGIIGLNKIAQQSPDLVTLDIEMPEMNGIETLKKIREHYPNLPVIMVSRFTEQGAEATIDALFFGANDYVLKPASSTDVNESLTYMRSQLLAKIKALAISSSAKNTQKVFPAYHPPQQKPAKVELIVIGSSTGGPNALGELLSGFTKPMPVPVLIAQHTLELFSKHIARRLSAKTGLSIVEAQGGEYLNTEQIYLAPGNQHLTLVRHGCMTQLLIQPSYDKDEPKPSVDKLFNSAAKLYSKSVLAVVLTGMGRDGLQGCRHIHQQKGQILVQDEASSVVWGMPGAVAKAGLADEILPLNQLAAAVMQHL